MRGADPSYRRQRQAALAAQADGRALSSEPTDAAAGSAASSAGPVVSENNGEAGVCMPCGNAGSVVESRPESGDPQQADHKCCAICMVDVAAPAEGSDVPGASVAGGEARHATALGEHMIQGTHDDTTQGPPNDAGDPSMLAPSELAQRAATVATSSPSPWGTPMLGRDALPTTSLPTLLASSVPRAFVDHSGGSFVDRVAAETEMRQSAAREYRAEQAIAAELARHIDRRASFRQDGDQIVLRGNVPAEAMFTSSGIPDQPWRVKWQGCDHEFHRTCIEQWTTDAPGREGTNGLHDDCFFSGTSVLGKR